MTTALEINDPITVLKASGLRNWTVSHPRRPKSRSRRQWLLYRAAEEYGWFVSKQDAIAVGIAIIAEAADRKDGRQGPLAVALRELRMMDTFAVELYRIDDGAIADVDLPGAIGRLKRALAGAINRKYDFLVNEAAKINAG